MPRPPHIFFLAGENSGDQRAAGVVEHIRRLRPEWRLTGLGGPRMQAAGMELLRDMTRDLAIVGFVEVLAKAPAIRRVYKTVRKFFERERPDAVVLVDYPGFNLDLVAPLARRTGVRVVYYVIPQFWAWRRSRIQKFQKYCDKLIPIFPFEEKLLRQEGVDAEYLGHPMLDRMDLTMTREEVFERFGLDPEKSLIGMLPGSRKREVRTLLPIMLEAAERMTAARGERFQFLLTRSETIPRDLIDTYVEGARAPVRVVDAEDADRLSIRSAFDFSWVKSGTSTLEAALLGAPFVIVYKVNYLTGLLARRILSTPFLGMPNIVAGDLVVPELLQEQATAQNLADHALHYLEDRRANEDMRLQLRKIRDIFGPPGSTERTAEAIVAFLEERASGESAS